MKIFLNERSRFNFLARKRKTQKAGGPLSQGRPKRLSVKEALVQPQIKDLIDIFQAEVVDIKMPPENG